MYVSNDDTKNYPFYGLQLVVETFAYLTWWSNQSKFIKVPKVEPIKIYKSTKSSLTERYYKTLGTSVKNSPVSPPSLPAYNPQRVKRKSFLV